jgi:hypothetical protein
VTVRAKLAFAKTSRPRQRAARLGDDVLDLVADINVEQENACGSGGREPPDPITG